MSGRGNPSSSRQVSDLTPPMTTNVSAPDPTAGERCACSERPTTYLDDDDVWRCWECTRPATPDADDASERLTEAERASIYATVRGYDEDQHPGPIYAAVERIKAAAATKARADERERIAQVIEAAVGYRGPNSQTDYGKGYNSGHQDRAVMDVRIARGVL